MELRSYQIDAIESVKKSLRAGYMRPVLQLPTGSGKTAIASVIIKSALAKGNRVIFAVPAVSLIDQSVQAFQAAGIDCIGVIQADHIMLDRSQALQVCSLQTLAKRRIPDAQLVIVDEIHMRFKSLNEWMAVWSKIPFIGLSATPWANGLGLHWDHLIKPVTMKELMDQGFLADYTAYAGTAPDLKGVKVTAGDYNLKALNPLVMDTTLICSIVPTWLKYGENEQTLFFATDRAHARAAQNEFEEAGISCAYIDAYTEREERAEILEAFEKQDIKVIANVGTLTTGVDADVRCLILARPTKSKALYVQIIGRALRINHALSNAVSQFKESGAETGCLVALKPELIPKIEDQLEEMEVKGLRVIADGEYIREDFYIKGVKPNKRRAILIDHSATISTLGFPEGVDQDELDCNEVPDPLTLEEIEEMIKQQEQLPKVCGRCKTLKEAGQHECPSCGYAPEKQSEITHEAGELFEIKRGLERKLEIKATKDKAKESNRKFTVDSTAAEKSDIHAQLLGYCLERKKKNGYAAHTYKEFYGKFPSGSPQPIAPSEQLLNKITAKNIRFSKRK